MNVASPQYMVFETLLHACSQDPHLLKPAELKLSTWEKEQGFFTTLMQIAVDPNLDTGARFMACVCIKNGIAKYWRRNAPDELREEEKTTIRAILISNFDETQNQIAVQLAVIVAKIARWDCPTAWPELVPRLLEAMQPESVGKQQHQAMLVFHHVVKALASRRIAADRLVFQELSQNVFDFMLKLWDGFTNLYFQGIISSGGGVDVEQSFQYLQKSTLALKSLRKLTILGFAKPDKSPNCIMFIKVLFQRLREFLDCRLQVQSHEPLKELTEKQIIKMMKTLYELQDHHPSACIQFIPDILEFAFYYAFNDGIAKILDKDNVIDFVPFAVNCINLMKALIGNTALGGNRPVTATLPEEIRVAMQMKDDFFTQHRIAYICEKLVLNYFVLTQAELEAWDDNPEFFADDETGDSCLYTLKPCAESFYLAMFNRFRPQMIAEVVKQTQVAQQAPLTEASCLKDILYKDAIYNAVGLSAFNLFDDIDFNEWFTRQLVHELHLSGSNFRIVRRRVIWLIGRWTGVKFSPELRPMVYAECLQLMRPEEDMTVRLAASAALMSTIDDFDFVAEEFQPFLESSFALLFGLLKGAAECETKMNVLNIMSLIIDKMNECISGQIENLIQYLPLLWEESNEHNMLRCAIVGTLLQIVRAVCDVPVQLAPFLYPVIGLSTNINEPSHVYLLEDGLDLWLAVVENSPAMAPELLMLCENILPIIEMTSEHLRTVICIMQAYILLDPLLYLQKYGSKLVECGSYLMKDMRPDGIVLILKLYEAIVRALPEEGLLLVRPALVDVFERVTEDKDYPMVMSLYLAIVSRTLLISQGVFSEVVQNVPVRGAFEQLLDVWLARMPCVVNKEKKKLLGLALVSLVSVQNDVVYERLPTITKRLCETLNDIMKEDDETGVLSDSLLLSDSIDLDDSELGDVDYRTRHAQRCKQLSLRDPVYCTSLKDSVHSQFMLMKSQLGSDRYQCLMQTISEEDLENLKDYFDLGMAIAAPQTAA